MSEILLNLLIFLPPVLFITFLVLTIVFFKKKNKGAKITFLILTILQAIVVAIEVIIFVALASAVAHM